MNETMTVMPFKTILLCLVSSIGFTACSTLSSQTEQPLQQLQVVQNIDALRIAFKLEKEKRQATVGERLLMMQYSGFGGLKFVLNPIANDIDINHWRKTEHDLFPITQELHQLLKENSEDDKQYRRYVDSMKSSVLTAFYTPPEVIDAISSALRDSGLHIDKFLEPSAGIGSFVQSFSESQKELHIEKPFRSYGETHGVLTQEDY
jgi:hypothetical protein